VRFTLEHDVPVARALPALTRRVLDVTQRAYVPTHRLAEYLPELLGCLSGAREPGPILVQLEPRPIPVEYQLGEAPGPIAPCGVRGPSEPCLTLKFLPLADGAMDLEAGYEPRHFDQPSIVRLMAGVRGVLEVFCTGDGGESPCRHLERLGG